MGTYYDNELNSPKTVAMIGKSNIVNLHYCMSCFTTDNIYLYSG